MSFLGFGRPQPSSAEKIAAVEAEMKLMADMMNRYCPPPLHLDHPRIFTASILSKRLP